MKVCKADGSVIESKYKIGERVADLGLVTGITYYEGVGYFAYRMADENRDIPEKELSYYDYLWDLPQ